MDLYAEAEKESRGHRLNHDGGHEPLLCRMGEIQSAWSSRKTGLVCDDYSGDYYALGPWVVSEYTLRAAGNWY